MKARISGMGAYLPKKKLTNQDLEKKVNTSDEWIFTRTGIRERRIGGAKETTSFMAAEAGRCALKDAGCKISEIDLILLASMTSDYLCPSGSPLVSLALGGKDIPCLDIQAACSGFLYGLSLAKAWIESGIYKRILLIASEKMSSFVDWEDRNTCILFGDGAAACVVLGKGAGLRIDRVLLGADGKEAELIMTPAGGSKRPMDFDALQKKLGFIRMNGKETFKHAVRRMGNAINDLLHAEGLTKEEISWLVPHQANSRILEATARACHLPLEKVYQTLERYGNTSASGVGIALHELSIKHPFKRGNHLILVAFGAGLTWGSACLTKV